MEEETDQQYLKALYDRFRSEVMNGGQIGYYEMDELLDVYDYAQDEGDVTVQFFVLQTAARLYPADHTLDERAGFFLSYLSSDAASDMLQRQGRQPSALWDVLDIALRNYPDGDPEADIRGLLKHYDTIDTETLIKLVDLLRDLDRPDLLVGNLKALRDKAEDLRAFLYEVADALRNYPDCLAEAQQAADELTALEPFNIDNWTLLGRIELAREHFAEALSAADYALAIDPDDPVARQLRAIASVPDDATRGQAVETLRELLKQDSENTLTIRALAHAYMLDNQPERAARVYVDRYLSDQNRPTDILGEPTNPVTASDILSIPFDNPRWERQTLDAFASLNSSDEEQPYLQLAHELCANSLPNRAIMVLEDYMRRFGQATLCEGVDLYINLLYGAERFDDVVDFFVAKAAIIERLNKKPQGELSPDDARHLQAVNDPLLLVFAASLLRSGHYRDARDLAEQLLHKTLPADGVALADRLAFKGMQATAAHIRSLACDRSLRPFPKGLDPLS